MKMMVRAVCGCLLLAMVGSLVGPLPASAASTQVQFQSNVGGSWTNEGFAYVNSVQYAFGQWYGINTGTYTLYAQKTIYSGGNRYDFDRWGPDGAVTITDLYNSVSSITISGQGDVYAWYILQDFTLDVNPSSIEVQSSNTAQYSFTVTRTNIPQDQSRNSLRVDLFASGMSWSASGPSYRFDPGDATFSSQSTQGTITGTLFINTINAAASTYTITVRGQVENANTYHEKQVSLKVNPNIPVHPDLIITDFSWTPSNPGVGQAISITYTEKNQGEGSAPGHTNALYIDGAIISTDDVGPLTAGASQTRSFPQTWTVSSGPHVILVKADSTNVVYEGEPGSDRENNNSKDKTLGSKIGTQLTVAVNPTSVPPGGGTLVTVSGKLTRTDTDAGLADRTISLTLPGQSASANTNSAGDYSYSYVTPNLVEGSHPVSADYSGDSTFSSCSAQTNLGVGQIPTAITINLNPTSISSGTPTAVVVSGKLSRSDTGAGLSGKTVRVDWPIGSTSVTTDSSGSYSYSLTVNTTQNWVIQATFAGDSTFRSCTTQTNLSVGQIPTAITINLNPASISSGTPTAVVVSGKLSRSDTGAGLSGKTVQVDWPVGSASVTTDSSGSYSYSLMVNTTQKWVIQATFAGDSTYLQSSNSAVLTVTMTEVAAKILNFHISNQVVKRGEKLYFDVQIENTGKTAGWFWTYIVLVGPTPGGKTYLDRIYGGPVYINPDESVVFSQYWQIPKDAPVGAYTVILHLFDGDPSDPSSQSLDAQGKAYWFMVKGASYIQVEGTEGRRLIHIHLESEDVQKLREMIGKGLISMHELSIALRASGFPGDVSEAEISGAPFSEVVYLPESGDFDLTMLQLSGSLGRYYEKTSLVEVLDAARDDLARAVLGLVGYVVPGGGDIVDIVDTLRSKGVVASALKVVIKMGGDFIDTLVGFLETLGNHGPIYEAFLDGKVPNSFELNIPQPILVEKLSPNGKAYTPGESMQIIVRVTDSAGLPIAGAKVGYWVWAWDHGMLQEQGDGKYATATKAPLLPGLYDISIRVYEPAKGAKFATDLFTSSPIKFSAESVEGVVSVRGEPALEEGGALAAADYTIFSSDLSLRTSVEAQKIIIEASSDEPRGRTVVIDIDNAALPIADVNEAVVLLDGKEIAMADNYTDVLDPANKDVPKYLVLIGAEGIQVLVWIPSFSTHTITVAKAPTFEASNLTISPPEVMAGEPVRISVTVRNDGGVAGSYLLALNISGAVEATKNLALEGGETENVTFELTKRAGGTYGVEVAGQTATFVVIAKPLNWLLIGGIVVAVALAGIAVGWRLRSKRKKPAGTT